MTMTAPGSALQWALMLPVFGGSLYGLLCVLAVIRVRTRGRRRLPEAQSWPPVTVLKPICGLEKDLAQNLHKQAGLRVGTGDLNRVIKQAMLDQSPAVRQNRLPKVYYATQVSMFPPTLVLFTNGPELFDNTYQRYLLKTLRDHFRFPDVPIKFYLRAKTQSARDDDEGSATKPKRITKARAKKKKENEVGELWDDV